jgi:hypothetical protein
MRARSNGVGETGEPVTFDIVTVPNENAGLFEPLGTKEKFWYGNNSALFKKGRPHTGENWAEVVTAEIADQLGIPHAEYKLAVCEGVRGVTTSNFVPAGGRLVLGNELIIPIATAETNVRQIRRQSHTAKRMATLLRHAEIQPPLGYELPYGVEGAAGVMTGYLLFDALIGNQDRHEENWGLIVIDQKIFLAPSFDHASSLGRNESDEARLAKLSAADKRHGVEGYAKRARSQIFNQVGVRLGTLEAFGEFLAQFPRAGRYWKERLTALDGDYLEGVLDNVPPDWISQPARDFACSLMKANRKRLLELPL